MALVRVAISASQLAITAPGSNPEAALLLDPSREGVERRDLVGIGLSVGERIGEEGSLQGLQPVAHAGGDLRDGDLFLLAAEPAGHDDPFRRNIPRTELDPHRHALELPFGELVAGPMLIAIVEAHADAARGQVGAQPIRDVHHRRALLVGPVDRHDDHLDRGDRRGQAKPGIVAVGHDRAAHHPGAEAPRGGPCVLLLTAGIEEGHVISLGEVLAQEMARAALERLRRRASAPRRSRSRPRPGTARR